MAAFGKSFSFSGGATGGSGQGGTSGGLFGSTNQPTTSTGGSLFGGTFEKRQRAGTITEAPGGFQSNSGAAFGQAALAAPASGGLFGSTQTPASGATGGLFGGSGTAAPATASGLGGGGLFGNTAAAQPAAPASLFGVNSASAAPAGGLFGNQPPASVQPQAQAPVQQQQQQPSEVEELSKQLLLIKECWDPASPNYQFRHYFYNVVESGQAHLYQCPAGQDLVLWQQAVSDNPDPSTLVPVLANGFDDLRKRVDSQSLQMQSYQERTAEISNKLGSILQKHHSETTVRLAECKRRQAELSQRLLEFMKLVQLLRLRGQLLHPEEELFRVRVEHLEKEMTRSGSLKQRLAEIQDHVYRLQATARRRRELLGHSSAGYTGDGYEVADEALLESVVKLLDDKQRGLARMTQVISQDAEAIDYIESTIEDRYAEVQKQKEARERAQAARAFAQPW
ncbi:Nucleoporin nup57 [Coemansia sp. RSA 2611]|nr:Nucleoporin nup57 [Coemansia sp. RSA 2611]